MLLAPATEYSDPPPQGIDYFATSINAEE